MKATRTYTMGSRAEAVAATRERIAREAVALFLEHAYEDVTLAAIAKAAGVSHQTVLNHFESKDGVVLAVAELLQGRDALGPLRRRRPATCAGAVRALVGDYERMGDANFRWAAVRAPRDPRRAPRRGPAEPPGVARRHVRRPAARPPRPPAGEPCTPCTPPPTSTCWKLLRRDLGLSRTETEKTIADLVVGVLEGTNR